MKHYADEWIAEWCQENGWTDPVMEPLNHYWAFPPGAVMPQPIPSEILRIIKAQKGLSPQEKRWSMVSTAIAFMLAIASYMLKSPMPLIAAFALGAITAARLEPDDI
ncbi:MAG: hypothetical protein ACFE0I_00535 [Elainellaceae cyanobacterium]